MERSQAFVDVHVDRASGQENRLCLFDSLPISEGISKLLVKHAPHSAPKTKHLPLPRSQEPVQNPPLPEASLQRRTFPIPRKSRRSGGPSEEGSLALQVFPAHHLHPRTLQFLAEPSHPYRKASSWRPGQPSWLKVESVFERLPLPFVQVKVVSCAAIPIVAGRGAGAGALCRCAAVARRWSCGCRAQYKLHGGARITYFGAALLPPVE